MAGTFFLLAIINPFAEGLFDITRLIFTKLFFLLVDLISDSKLEPLPEINIAAFNLVN